MGTEERMDLRLVQGVRLAEGESEGGVEGQGCWDGWRSGRAGVEISCAGVLDLGVPV